MFPAQHPVGRVLGRADSRLQGGMYSAQRPRSGRTGARQRLPTR